MVRLKQTNLLCTGPQSKTFHLLESQSSLQVGRVLTARQSTEAIKQTTELGNKRERGRGNERSNVLFMSPLWHL